MGRFSPVGASGFGQTAGVGRFSPVSAPAGPTTDERSPDVAGAIGAGARLGRSALNVADFAFRDEGGGSPVGLRDAGALLGVAGGVADIARGATSDGNGLQRGTTIARGGVQVARSLAGAPSIARFAPEAAGAVSSGLNAGVSVGGGATVPYVNAALAGLNIAGIAQSDEPDAQKAYDALHQVGRTVADAYLPVVGGFAADMVSGGLRDLLFHPDAQDITKKFERGNFQGGLSPVLGARMMFATTPEELDAAATLTGGKSSLDARVVNGALQVGSLTGLGSEGLNGLYQERKALIARAAAGDARARADLAQAATAFADFKRGAGGLMNRDPSTFAPDELDPLLGAVGAVRFDPRYAHLDPATDQHARGAEDGAWARAITPILQSGAYGVGGPQALDVPQVQEAMRQLGVPAGAVTLLRNPNWWSGDTNPNIGS